MMIPDISFTLRKIQPIPILSTPLSNRIARRDKQVKVTGIVESQIGYVTLNQTRKIVPIIELDNSTSNVPIVGVWLAFDNDEDDNDDVSDEEHQRLNDVDHNVNSPSFLRNPLTWAMCVRFLANENIKDRVFVAPSTFLLVSFNIEICFE